MRDEPLTLSSHPGQHPETLILELHGPLTLPNIFSFQERIASLRTQNVVSALIIDLTGTAYMDSAGLGCIINCYVSATKNNHKFFLAGANHRITALLETAHVHRLIYSYPTVQDAELTMG